MPLVDLINTQMRVRSYWLELRLVLLSSPSKLIGYLVYNHVLKLDLGSLQWSLVDNYGDIPGVRMGKCVILTQWHDGLRLFRSYGLLVARR